MVFKIQTLNVGDGSLPTTPVSEAEVGAGFPEPRSILTLFATTFSLLLLLLLSSETILFSMMVTLFFTVAEDEAADCPDCEERSSPLSEVTAATVEEATVGLSSAGILNLAPFPPGRSRVFTFLLPFSLSTLSLSWTLQYVLVTVMLWQASYI